MKTIIGILFGLITLLFSCDNDDIETVKLENGTYTGHFQRINPLASMGPSSDFIGPSRVTLTFNNGSFTGESDRDNYPAICRGTYTLNDPKIEFKNDCMWIAEFDWTLILSGTFTITVDGAKLVMTRSYDGDISDRYELTRQ